jgi:uncharacterized membrane protein YdjX (TVP38/TMEM64 family)
VHVAATLPETDRLAYRTAADLPEPPPNVRISKGITTWIWLTIVLAILLFWIAEPSAFAPERLESSFRALGPWAFTGFVIASLVRGALLIPSTPVVLAGGALFPDRLPLVLLVSMIGIVVSAVLLYRFPGFAGYDRKLAAKYPEKLERLQGHLRKPRAVVFVTAWAFFPAVPTDLICYAAGLVRMPLRRLLTGIVIGELPLVTAYILAGRHVAGLLT